MVRRRAVVLPVRVVLAGSLRRRAAAGAAAATTAGEVGVGGQHKLGLAVGESDNLVLHRRHVSVTHAAGDGPRRQHNCAAGALLGARQPRSPRRGHYDLGHAVGAGHLADGGRRAK